MFDVEVVELQRDEHMEGMYDDAGNQVQPPVHHDLRVEEKTNREEHMEAMVDDSGNQAEEKINRDEL